ncbi:MAG: FliM/FliN family flagellar motor switch protein [Phycisphaerae bacterium]|nr:FliM/FliN family flagellar motor switch protein [Phycisphaerae bacterium]
MQQILAAIGSRPEPNEIDEAALDQYDWNQIRYFDTAQIQAVTDFGEKVTPLLACALKRAFRNDFVVELTTIHQTTAAQYKDKALKTHAFLAFRTDDKTLQGTLALPTATTQDWQTRLLGDASNPGESRSMSPLEVTLLSDVAVSLVEAFSAGSPYDLVALPPLSVAHMNTPLVDTDELCTLTFRFRNPKASEDTAQEMTLVMPCVQLGRSLEGMTQTASPSQGQLAETMRQHVNHVPLSVTAEFASVQLTLEQAMDLHVGDVLLLGKDLDDPVALKVDDRLVFYGIPVQCEDHYAVKITQNA